jgi:hypothetical protein
VAQAISPAGRGVGRSGLPEQLVLRTILCLRWRFLERLFLEQAAGLVNGQLSDAQLDQLTQSEAVQAVLGGTAVGATLDLATIRFTRRPAQCPTFHERRRRVGFP